MTIYNPQYIFCSCQHGAQNVLKNEILSAWPDFRLAFSRPGFVTFKIPENIPANSLSTLNLNSTFTRTSSVGLGKVSHDDPGTTIRTMLDQLPLDQIPTLKHVHVWERDSALPGTRDFEPGRNPLTDALASQIAIALAAKTGQPPATENKIAKVNDAILDVVLVEPNQWWYGWHQATTTPSRWPGGIYSIQLPPQAVSRSYLKMEEALKWARLPIQPGDLVAEIGSAPGGSCQSLLAKGLRVHGIDPAEMDPSVLNQPNFVHVRKKAAQVRRIEFSGVKWLTADANVTPNYTLDSVEPIVTHDQVNIRGMLLTLKLANWDLASKLPVYLERIRGWGYQYIRTRQLAFNRREICVAVMKSRASRRIKRSRKKK